MRFYKVEEIRERLADCNIQAVARKIGVHPQTLYAIKDAGKYPNYKTYKKLVEHFEGVTYAVQG